MPHIFYLEISLDCGNFVVNKIIIFDIILQGLILEYRPTICLIRIIEVFHKYFTYIPIQLGKHVRLTLVTTRLALNSNNS